MGYGLDWGWAAQDKQRPYRGQRNLLLMLRGGDAVMGNKNAGWVRELDDYVTQVFVSHF